MNDIPVYDWDDAIEFISKRCDISVEDIKQVLSIEEDYMRSVGIIDDTQS
jgi:hypothetical protein